MSLEVRWTEGSNGPLQVNSLDLKNPKKTKQNRTWSRLWEKFGLKVEVNGMENCKGNGETVKPLGRSKALKVVTTVLME